MLMSSIRPVSSNVLLCFLKVLCNVLCDVVFQLRFRVNSLCGNLTILRFVFSHSAYSRDDSDRLLLAALTVQPSA